MSDFNMNEYLNKKKQTYFLEFTCGDHVIDGVFIYKITFNKEISRREFNNIMQKARECNDNYGHLCSKEFLEKHDIRSFEKVQIDYFGSIN